MRTSLQHRLLPTMCSIIFLLLPVFLVFFQWVDAGISALRSQWLIVIGVPTLIGLLVRGYITQVVRFGVQLGALVEALASALTPSVANAIQAAPPRLQIHITDHFMSETSPKRSPAFCVPHYEVTALFRSCIHEDHCGNGRVQVRG